MDVSSSEGGLITSLEALVSLCGQPGWVALASDTDRIIPKYRAFIESSSYVTIATGGPEGPDCSPRGDAPGFVRVSNEKTLLIPDRVGNNRIETLRNLVRDPRIALHFLVPGCAETLRVKGHAAISNNSILLQTMVANGKLPRTVIIVSVERAYFHCGKALKRSRLWETVKQPSAARMPGPNAMMASVQWGRLRERIMARARTLPIGK